MVTGKRPHGAPGWLLGPAGAGPLSKGLTTSRDEIQMVAGTEKGQIESDDDRLCPWCASRVRANAFVCPKCGTELSDRVDIRPGRGGPNVKAPGAFHGEPVPSFGVRFWGRTLDSLMVGIPVALLVRLILGHGTRGLLVTALISPRGVWPTRSPSSQIRVPTQSLEGWWWSPTSSSVLSSFPP
jgi:hypothetical protein